MVIDLHLYLKCHFSAGVFKYFASKNQLPGFYVKGTLVGNELIKLHALKRDSGTGVFLWICEVSKNTFSYTSPLGWLLLNQFGNQNIQLIETTLISWPMKDIWNSSRPLVLPNGMWLVLSSAKWICTHLHYHNSYEYKLRKSSQFSS